MSFIPSPDEFGQAIDKAGADLIQKLGDREALILNALLDRIHGAKIHITIEIPPVPGTSQT